MNYRQILNICFQVDLILGLVSCTTMAETIAASPTVSLPTIMPTTPVTSTQSAKEFILDPNTMKSCSEMKRQKATQQVNYRDITPSFTTDNQVSSLLGAPKDKYSDAQGIQTWRYNDFLVNFENGTVITIYVYKDDLVLRTLENTIESLGCPAMIYAVDGAEDPSGHYDNTWLIYNEIGISFRYDTYPIQFSQRPYVVVYSESQSVDEYLYYWNLGVNKKGIPASWDDAVK